MEVRSSLLIEQKIKLYEYSLVCFYEWYLDLKENESKNKLYTANDISVLKSMKLLFLLTAESYFLGETEIIEKYFCNFHAMPYGPVESDIYNYLNSKKGELEFVKINSITLTIKNPSYNYSKPISNTISEIKEAFKKNSKELELLVKIDNAIKSLKKRNNSLIGLPPFDLVDLSHRRFSWKKNISIAYLNNKNSFAIPVADIKNEVNAGLF